MRGPGSTLRMTASLSAGALAVHQLRYVLGYGDSSSEALAAHGHGYLAALGPAVGLILAVAAAHFIVGFARRAAPGSGSSRAPLLRLWLGASCALVAVYVGQELAEGVLAPGHPAGVAGVLAHGGWIALLLALFVGGVVALVCRGAQRVLARRAAAAAVSRDRRAMPAWAPVAVDGPRLRVLARHLAGRAPPLVA